MTSADRDRLQAIAQKSYEEHFYAREAYDGQRHGQPYRIRQRGKRENQHF